MEDCRTLPNKPNKLSKAVNCSSVRHPQRRTRTRNKDKAVNCLRVRHPQCRTRTRLKALSDIPGKEKVFGTYSAEHLTLFFHGRAEPRVLACTGPARLWLKSPPSPSFSPVFIRIFSSLLLSNILLLISLSTVCLRLHLHTSSALRFHLHFERTTPPPPLPAHKASTSTSPLPAHCNLLLQLHFDLLPPLSDMEERRNRRDCREYILPGPNDPSLLYGQAEHRSEAIWQQTIESGPIGCRRTADLEKVSNYSWGGACLAWLYRQLCKATNPEVMQMAGPLFILQIWAWDRITAVSPILSNRVPHHDAPLGSRWSNARQIIEIVTHVLVELRYQLDRLLPEQVIWEPYTDALIESLPEYCRQGREIWRAVVPLICFHIVEWHQPDRVMRQFGMQQHIPAEPQQSAALHDVDLRKSDTNWAEVHSHWIARWNTRDRRIISGPPATESLHFHSEYMEWYRRVSRRWISIKGAAMGTGEDGLEHMYAIATNPTTGSMTAMCDLIQSVSFCMMEERRQTQLPAPQPAPVAPPSMDDPDDPPIPDSFSRGSRGRTRGHGRGRRRDHTQTEQGDRDVHPMPPPIQYHRSQGLHEDAPSSSIVPPSSSQVHGDYSTESQGLHEDAPSSSIVPPSSSIVPPSSSQVHGDYSTDDIGVKLEITANNGMG